MREHANKCISQIQGSDQDNSTDVYLSSDGIEDYDGPIGESINCVIEISGVAVKVSIALPVSIIGIPAGKNWPKINIVTLDIVVLLPSLSDPKCLTINMGQNVPLPSLERDQYGDAYYMNPVNLYLFGVNENKRPDGNDHTNAYIWSEADDRQGANNIFSCLFKYLRSEVSFRAQTLDCSISWQTTAVFIIKTKTCSVLTCG